MIDSKKLLSDLESKKTSRATMVKRLEDDLRKRCNAEPDVDAPLKEQYQAAKAKKRTALTYKAWRDEELTQIAVAWVLGCVFVRFLEDNKLVETPKLSGPGERLRRARDEHELFFQRHPTSTEREFLLEVFEETGRLPGMKEFFDKKHNPLWLAAPSGDACRELWQFWQKTDPETGALRHDFTDPEWNTRFLGDLYQDLSDAARDKYALLQTPDFVEDFMLDRTLTPAIETFGYREVRMIDPACGSGHFLLGGFRRIFRIWQEECTSENTRILAQRALDSIYGVDLNPFAVAIARFRLLLAALQACGLKRLKDSPDFTIHLAVGDSLLHGPEPGIRMDSAALEMQIESANGTYQAEDARSLAAILSQQYHAVVANPPYISVKDPALRRGYKAKFHSCYGRWVLSCPFMERIFDLTMDGSREYPANAGFNSQITSNSFMKREFGKKLIEECISSWDIQYIVDTGGAFIPGHGTPTVILMGRNRLPTQGVIRIAMGINGEPKTPEVPANGLVWQAIIKQLDQPGSKSKWIEVKDVERTKFKKHPWSIGGGGASILKELIEANSETSLAGIGCSCGITSVTGEDDLYVFNEMEQLQRIGVENTMRLIEGEFIRDWMLCAPRYAVWLYDDDYQLISLEKLPKTARLLWLAKQIISKRRRFGTPMLERGLTWYEWQELYDDKLRGQRLVAFASVASHNHFWLSTGDQLFKQSAPVVVMPDGFNQQKVDMLVGLLNSSLACFWLKQVCYPKASSSGDISKIKGKPEANRYDINSRSIEKLPLPSISPELAIEIGRISREMIDLARKCESLQPEQLVQTSEISVSLFAESEVECASAKEVLQLKQEELNKLVFRAYGLIGEVEGACSDEIQELLDFLESPVYKRQWLGRQGVYGSASKTYRELVVDAVGRWLTTRLEGYFHEGKRVCDLGDSFDPAAQGFTAFTRPHLVSSNQLADVVQSDAKFLDAAEIYVGSSGFSVAKLVRELVEAECVPFLPIFRYKESGLRKRHDWEETWDQQRKEDAVEARVRKEQSDEPREKIENRIRKAQETEVGSIPVPTKYAAVDFTKPSYWKLRGKLDVPKERWISYPGAERAGDDSLLIAWAGWDHLQQAQALSEYFLDAKDNQGWSLDRLRPLLAGLADLIPWLKQWHNAPDPNLGMGLGDYFAGFLEEQCRTLQTTVEEVNRARFGTSDH